MATRVVAVGEVTGIVEMERRLVELVEQVEREKEKTRDTFQQLHSLLIVREGALLRELDEVVVEARQELKDKKKALELLRAAKESTERDLNMNLLIELQKQNLKNIEAKIREELSKPLNVTWVEVEWKREQLEQSIVEMSKVVKMKERHFRTEDYPLKLRSIWYHEGNGSSFIVDPQQLAIDTISGNIFVSDYDAKKIQVFSIAGHYLYHIPTPPQPIGLCLSDEFIYVTTDKRKLVKIQISNNKSIKSVVTEKEIYCMDISSNIFVCESCNESVIVFDKNLNFLKRISLKSLHFTSDTVTCCIKLYENNLYVMFRYSDYCLQVFSQDGQMIRGVIRSSDINYSFFFSLDQFGNIIVADGLGRQIKIFSNSGQLIHIISNDTLTGDHKLSDPAGISVDKHNNIVVAQKNKKYNLIAF